MTPTGRSRILDAAKELVWERGVEGTSPTMLLERSGMGQGSLYHHFGSKAGWASAAITALAEDLTAETDAVLAAGRPGIERLRDYLARPRAALDGCRLGRLAFDPEVVARPELREPVAAYFEHLEAALATAIDDARRAGDLTGAGDTGDLAAAMAGVVQGGYVTSRLTDDPERLTRAVAGLLSLLTPGTTPTD